jgi:hypothetical protein
MALREQVQSFRFSGGIETKSDPKTVPTTRLLRLENGVFTKATSIKKRNGYELLASVPGAIRSAQRGDELLAFTPSRAWSVASDGTLSDTGAVYSPVGTDRPLSATGTQQTMSDHASLDGVTVAAWEDSAGGVWWTTLDEDTGRIYRPATQADASGQAPRCVPCGDNLLVFYSVPSTHRIYVVVVNPTTPAAAVTPILLTDDLDGSDSSYDVCPTARTHTPAAIAWWESGTTKMRLGYVDQSGALGVPLLGHPSTVTYAASRLAGSPIGISHGFVDGADGDRIAIAYVSAGPLGTTAFFTGGNLATSPITVVTGANVYTPTNVQRVAISLVVDSTAGTKRAWTAWEEFAAAASNRFVKTTSMEITAGASGVVSTVRSVGLASKAFAIGTDVFATFVHDTTFFNTYVTLRISDTAADGFVEVGRHLPAQASGAPTRKHLSSAHVVGSVAAIALPMKERLISENDDKFTETRIRLIEMDFDNERSHQSANFGRGLYMAGACPLHYDGRRWSELGFHVGPELIATATGAGGSMTSGATYEYRAWYEQTDAQGEVHPGPVSIGTLITLGGGDSKVTLTLPTLRLTRKSGVRIMVARSLPGSTGNASQLWRVTSMDPATAGANNGYVPNSTTTDTATFVDVMSDTTLQTFDELYTDGGILSNDPAPLGAAIARGKDRLFASDPSDGAVVRYSQPFKEGYGVRWPPDLFLRIDPPAGDVMAIASKDDRQIVWTERAIYTFSGGGPAEDGTTADLGSGFSFVQTVPTDVGCSEPASVLLIPSGYMFKSTKGIYQLSNDFSVLYIGAPVEAYNAQTIRRANLLPDRTQVAFLTDAGLTLLYDHLFGQWSTFTNHEGVDAAVAGGQYHYIRNDGRIYRETIGVYIDENVRIRLRLETAWIHMQEHLQGFEKFHEAHILGTWISAHQLGVQYQTDYTQGWTDSVWYDATAAATGTGWISGSNVVGLEPISGSEYGSGEYGDGPYGGSTLGEYAFRLDLYETGQSIQLRFEDFEAAGFFGASFELTELAITGAVLGHVRRPMTAGRSA